MYNLLVIGISLGLFLCCQCQYPNGQYPSGQYNTQEALYQNTPPTPQILTHKQALNHDGNFKYLFTSENGLAQGESIAPDGSRNGGYSYVDPTGRKISIKYTAGKEGFRILEGDHLPKAPQPIAPLPAAAAPQQQQIYQPNYLNRQEDDGQYRPDVYERPQQLVQLPSITQARPAYAGPRPVAPVPLTNAIAREEKDYYDEPGKPHTFGNGYLFEFSG